MQVDITLEVGTVNESEIVRGETSRVQTEESALGTTVDCERIEQLPMNRRNVFALVGWWRASSRRTAAPMDSPMRAQAVSASAVLWMAGVWEPDLSGFRSSARITAV